MKPTTYAATFADGTTETVASRRTFAVAMRANYRRIDGGAPSPYIEESYTMVSFHSNMKATEAEVRKNCNANRSNGNTVYALASAEYVAASPVT